MSVSQTAWIGDACTGIALSFISRDFGEREVVSACQEVIHELQHSLSVELCGALGEMGREQRTGLFIKELMVWERCRGPQLWLSVKNKPKQNRIQRFFFSFTLSDSNLSFGSHDPKDCL